MQFHKTTAELYVPDGKPAAEALSRTTHIGVSAHQDDIEIMAMGAILACFGQPDKHFSCVIATDGAGSARSGVYERYSDAEMQKVRRVEQKKAAMIGEYSFCAFLDYPSKEIKSPAESGPATDLAAIFDAARPEAVYLHNLCDKHDTHVSTALRAIRALRSLPKAARPAKLYGCEVWRDLDWMNDKDKVVFNCTGRESLQAALLGVFDSQISGGKRYDLATLGRRRAHATYHESHAVDAAELLNFGMDLTPLLENDTLDPLEFAVQHIRRFEQEVRDRLTKLS
jgi:LmbE family N-acetylglucosaminyl deacetylase